MTDEDDFVAFFREEAAERLQTIDAVLLELEAGREPPDALDSLFREFHTIKGAAGLVGVDDAQTLAHAVEDLLGSARDACVPLAGLEQPLLRAADALRAVVGGSASAPSALIDELVALRAELGGAPEPEPEPASAPQPAPATPAPSPAAPAEPARAIRVAATKLDRVLDLVGETVLHRRRLAHVLGAEVLRESPAVADELAHGDRLLDDLQDTALTMRTLPLRSITGPFARAVRDIAASEGKEAELEITGAETELDRVILERLGDPLVHVFRNAVHHGIEPPEERERVGKPRRGTIVLHAEQRGALVGVCVADDGRGVSEKALAEATNGTTLADVLARAGFSTADAVTDVAGRGVGLDAVKRQVEALGGRLEVSSEPGAGTQVMFLLPLTLALLDVLLAERDAIVLALPLASVLEVLRAQEPLTLAGRRSVALRGEPLPLVDVADVLGTQGSALPPAAPALVVAAGGGRMALHFDRVLGEDQVVVKPLGPLLAAVTGYLGAAILGDGRVALIVDPAAIDRRAPTTAASLPARAPAAASEPAGTVLVVEDSFTVRELQRSILEASGHSVETARDGAEAWQRIRNGGDIGLVVTDVDMPRMDGFALLEAIRADREHTALPVVIVTARGDEADRRRGLDAGADAYVEKGSFDQQALLAIVERLLGR